MLQCDVITVGDALIDCFLRVDGESKYISLHPESSQIDLTSGAKILIDDALFLLGGNATNTAVGFSRLGLTTGIAAEIGDDEFSKKILTGLTKDNVYVTLLQQTPGAQSSFSVCLNFMKERTLFVRHVERKHEMSFADVQTQWVYLTSLGKQWHSAYANVVAFVKSSGAKLVLNPGSHQLQEGRESFKDVLAATYVLIVNKEEAEEIVYGSLQHTQNLANQPETLLHELKKFGPKLVCITDGENGSMTLDEQDVLYTQAILPAQFVEKTGAGDAYAAGFIAALVAKQDVATAMRWGAGESAGVVEHIGATPGLLTKDQLLARIETTPLSS